MTEQRTFYGVRKVHCVGIGGAGMSGLARLLRARGIDVTGSDATPTDLTRSLQDEGITVDHEQAGDAIDRATDLVVASAAISRTNTEMVKARGLHVPVIKYAEAVGRLMADRAGIAVAGTHGKTTTSSMLTWILENAGREPSFVIGGEPHNLGINARHGHGSQFVVEACEYDRSFLQFNPVVAVVTNVDADHLDYYRDIDEICDAFVEFARGVPEHGLLVANADCDASRAVVSRLKRVPVQTFGFAEDATWSAQVLSRANGSTRFVLLHDGTAVEELVLRQPGLQNVSNALAAAAAASWFGVSPEAVASGLASFTGVGRRFHQLGEYAGVPVIDDYAHHPKEIEATLEAARAAWPGRKLWVVFQPHQVFRTQAFFGEFAESLSAADAVFTLDVFAAREEDENPLHSELPERLAGAVTDLGCPATHVGSMAELVQALRGATDPDVTLLTIGAGNVNEVAQRLVA